LVLNSTATGLIYSTYLGGDDVDQAFGISVDSVGNAAVAGFTFSPKTYGGWPFPTTAGAFQSNRKRCVSAGNCQLNADAWIASLSPQGGLVASTYIGGSVGAPATVQWIDAESKAYGVAVDQEGSIFAGGYTICTDFPFVNAIQPTNAGGQDVFLVKFDPSLSTLLFSTYFGGSGDDLVPLS
jgi:hypothetical protein